MQTVYEAENLQEAKLSLDRRPYCLIQTVIGDYC